MKATTFNAKIVVMGLDLQTDFADKIAKEKFDVVLIPNSNPKKAPTIIFTRIK